MSSPPRRSFAETQRVGMIRKHLIDRVPISDLCDEYKIQPTQYYDWQNGGETGTPQYIASLKFRK